MNRLPYLLALLLLAACTGTSAASEDDSAAHQPMEPEATESASDQAPEENSESTEPEVTSREVYPEELERHPDDEVEYDSSEVYAQVCVTCHGEDGDGMGTDTETFSFGSPEAEWSNGPTVDGILITLDDGIHNSPMRAFERFTNEDRIRLAEYVLELRDALR